MNTASATAHGCRNLLLALLPDEKYEALRDHVKLVRLDANDTVSSRDEPFESVYFPCSCVLSVLAHMESGAAVEVGTIGNEGFSGIDLLIGQTAAIKTTICQIPGDSWRMPVAIFTDAIAVSDSALRGVCLRYLQAYLAQVSQSVACNRLHTIEERFSRWVLMTHDRVQQDDFPLTQEFLAVMLGVHRPGVSLVAGAFQRAGLIRYSRGHLTILDRAGLEATVCECYGIVRKSFDRALGTQRG
jgi:CRP-like cAMP-binding protein